MERDKAAMLEGMALASRICNHLLIMCVRNFRYPERRAMMSKIGDNHGGTDRYFENDSTMSTPA